MKEQEIIINNVSSDDIKRKPIDFEIPEVQDFESRYAAELPRRRGAAPSTNRRKPERKPNPDENPIPKKHGSKKKPSMKKRKIILILVCLALLLVLIGSCKLIQFMNNPLIGETDEDILKAQDAIKDDMVTVLLVGTDGGGTNTDTIILATLNTKAKEINLISVPRDTRVPNPHGGTGYAKINSVYAAKGMSGLISQVRDVTGMPINFYAMINFEGFRKAIDILGGVKFNVPVRMKYYDPTQNLNIDLYPGMQRLDGTKAEQLVRCRNVYAQADLARTEVQRDFIIAMIEQHATLGNVGKIPDLFNTLEPYVRTSITASDALKYGTAVAGIDSANLKSHMLPGSAGSYGASNVSYFVYDADAAQKLAREIGFENAKVKKIPSPGKPNSEVTDAEDVDADQTLEPDDQTTPEDEDEEDDTKHKDTEKDKDQKDDEDQKDSSKNKDKDKDKDNKKDSNDKDEEKNTEKPSDKKEESSSSDKQDTNDYPDGI